MKMLNKYILFLFACLMTGVVMGQVANAPMSYSQFREQKGLETTEGFYTVYNLGDKYYLEIPGETMGKDVLVTTQITDGYASFISPASGVVRFSKGRNNMLFVYRLRPVEVTDSADVYMAEALRKSGLIPVDYTYPIVANGEKDGDVIIDLTNELNNAGGNLFNVSGYSLLSHPDPVRSGIEGVRAIENGVVFSVVRSQTDYQNNPRNGAGSDIASTFKLGMVLQLLPEEEMKSRETHPAYGFETVSRMFYDTEKYTARKLEYIQRWRLTASPEQLKQQKRGVPVQPERQIRVYIDPLIPQPFVESIENALAQWSSAFEKAGWKNVFRLTRAANDGALTYGTILFRWGSAYNDNNYAKIVNPVTGEILCARVNVMDENAKGLLDTYFVQCGLLDARVQKDLYDVTVRQDIVTAQVASLFAQVLGMLPNGAGKLTFKPEDLRSEKWLNKYGISASVSSAIRFNYLAKPEDKISVKNLFPKVSVYDCEALQYAYGNSDRLPSMKNSFYMPEEKLLSSFNQKYDLSCDLFEASLIGIENIQEIYPKLSKLLSNLPREQNTWKKLSDYSIRSLALYQAYLEQMMTLIGGSTKHTVIRGINEAPVSYVSREKQIEVLDYMEKNVFQGVNPWVYKPEWYKKGNYNLDEMMKGMAIILAKRFYNQEAIIALIESERKLGAKKAYTVEELFAYVDRVIFENFDAEKPVSDYKRALQAGFAFNFTTEMAKNNISFGLGRYGIDVLHAYFIKMAQEVKRLSETHQDPVTRENYRLILMKLNREYFDKK